MSEDANDVSKALAAFGAPSIRYHSFGQATVKPSGIAAPRRPAATALPPTVIETESFVTQTEPVAAPEPMMEARIAPAPMAAPRPSPVFREQPATRPAPLFPPTPTVAPPPRPLAEWAAPVVSAPTRPPVVAPTPTVAPATVAPIESFSPAPAPHTEPRPTPTLVPEIIPDPVAVNYPVASTSTVPVTGVAARRPKIANSSSSLVDIFEFLGAS
jgi:hypothetical protein